ncbi:MAG: winged helix DNA-binding domain-containing protein, partial [Tannerellaceae bacterium]|nr:winged helix DNA-binding domain-containing protein [Tannerellaceae bacterium]
QQLDSPKLTKTKDLVSWMGAVQAQDYKMVKWAIGCRLNLGKLSEVDSAIDNGDIIRTHILRPTWHFVSSNNLKWMLRLSSKKIISANTSRGKLFNLEPELYFKCNNLIEKILDGNQHLTKQEIKTELNIRGCKVDQSIINRIMIRAEADGIICSGKNKNNKPTYSLLEERIKISDDLNDDEAFIRLATMYFQSHSPATFQDFAWWSGLSLSQSKKAIDFIKDKLFVEKHDSSEFYIYDQCYNNNDKQETFCFLPPYDEFLISYKNRTHVLDTQYQSKAFSERGIFYPVIMYQGKIAGNWLYNQGKDEFDISLFNRIDIPLCSIKKAEDKYRFFINS